MELRQIAATLWKWAWLLILATAVAAASSWWVVKDQPPIYQTSTTLMIGTTIQQVSPDYTEFYTAERLAQTYSELIRREPVLKGTAAALGFEDQWRALRGQVTASLVAGTELMEIRVIDTDPVRAKQIADEVTRQLMATVEAARPQGSSRSFIQEQVAILPGQIQKGQAEIQSLQEELAQAISAREIQDLKTQISALETQVNNWRSTFAQYQLLLGDTGVNVLTVIEEATIPTVPSGNQGMMQVALAAAIGLMLALGAAFLIEYLDDTVKSPLDVERKTGLPTFGVIIRFPPSADGEGPVTAIEPRSSIAEGYRVLRTNLQFATLGLNKSSTVLLITSAQPTEGKTTTVANLGVSLAQAGKKVLLVDADLRRPSLHKLFKISKDVGLTSLLIEREANLDYVVHKTEIENLSVLPSGPVPANPAEVLGFPEMSTLIERLRGLADYVLMDSPPALSVADTSVLAQKVDGVLMVVEAGLTRTEMFERAVAVLQRVKARILGSILTKVGAHRGAYSYDYYYYYSSYYTEDGTHKRKRGHRDRSLMGRIRHFLRRGRRSEHRSSSTAGSAAEGTALPSAGGTGATAAPPAVPPPAGGSPDRPFAEPLEPPPEDEEESPEGPTLALSYRPASSAEPEVLTTVLHDEAPAARGDEVPMAPWVPPERPLPFVPLNEPAPPPVAAPDTGPAEPGAATAPAQPAATPPAPSVTEAAVVTTASNGAVHSVVPLAEEPPPVSRPRPGLGLWPFRRHKPAVTPEPELPSVAVPQSEAHVEEARPPEPAPATPLPEAVTSALPAIEPAPVEEAALEPAPEAVPAPLAEQAEPPPSERPAVPPPAPLPPELPHVVEPTGAVPPLPAVEFLSPAPAAAPPAIEPTPLPPRPEPVPPAEPVSAQPMGPEVTPAGLPESIAQVAASGLAAVEPPPELPLPVEPPAEPEAEEEAASSAIFGVPLEPFEPPPEPPVILPLISEDLAPAVAPGEPELYVAPGEAVSPAAEAEGPAAGPAPEPSLDLVTPAAPELASTPVAVPEAAPSIASPPPGPPVPPRDVVSAEADELWSEALDLYRHQEWPRAREALLRLTAIDPTRGGVESLLRDVDEEMAGALTNGRGPTPIPGPRRSLLRPVLTGALLLALVGVVLAALAYSDLLPASWMANLFGRGQAQKLVTRGYDYFIVDDYPAAIASFNEALAIDPENQEAKQGLQNATRYQELGGLYDQAQTQMKNGTYDQAAATLQSIIKVDPWYKEADKLLVQCQTAIDLEKLRTQAEIHYAAGEWASAVNLFKDVLAKGIADPDGTIRARLLESYVNQGRLEIALADSRSAIIHATQSFNSALALDSTNVTAQKERQLASQYLDAFTAYESGDWRKAVAELTRVLADQSDYGRGQAMKLLCSSHIKLGDSYQASGQADSALQQYRLVLTYPSCDAAEAESRIATLTATPTPAPTTAN